MPRLSDLLWERLLRGGVGRRHARRYLAELQDHLDDLTAEEQQPGRSPGEARRRAVARLGEAEALADAMIAQAALRAWSHRRPVITYLIAPSLILAVGMGLAMAAVVMTCAGVRSSGAAQSELPSWLAPLLSGVIFFSNAMISVLLGWTLAALAIRQRSPAAAPTLGIFMLASVGAVIQVAVVLPSAALHGEITLMPGFGPSFFHEARYVHRLILNLTLTLLPYLVFSTWRGLRIGLGDQGIWRGREL